MNSPNTTDQTAIPACELLAAWPHSYADIYFGQDNCLYDSGGQSIYDQCCTAIIGTTSVANPYFQQSNPTSTSSVYPHAWPSATSLAGFHIIGYSSSEGIYSDVSLGVVGSANDNCTTIIYNQDKYGAYGYLENGDIMYPNYVNSSTTQFYLLPKSDSDGLPLCGVSRPKNFQLSFFSTWATNGPGSFGKETSYLIFFG